MANLTAYGVDVASFQGIIDWKQVWRSGFRFAYVKTTQYPGYLNPYSAVQRSEAWNRGFRVGNYCYLAAKLGDPVGQAQLFLSHSNIKEWHLLPFLDVEEIGSEGASPTEIEETAYEWGLNVAKFLKVKRLILYTDLNMLRYRIKVTRRLQRLYMLDLAFWSLGPPPNLRGWDLVMQQYDTARGVPGIVGPVDKDKLFVPMDSLTIKHNQTGSTPKPVHSPRNRNWPWIFRGNPRW